MLKCHRQPENSRKGKGEKNHLERPLVTKTVDVRDSAPGLTPTPQLERKKPQVQSLPRTSGP